MYFSDSITLRAVAWSQNTDGSPKETNTDTTVNANVNSVSRSEFYQANVSGIDAVISFEIHAEDWGNQTRVVYSSKTYYIVRAYQKGEGIVVLTCSDKEV